MGTCLSVNSLKVCVNSLINDVDKRVLSSEAVDFTDKLMVHCGSSGDGDGGNHDLDMLVSLHVADEQAVGKHAEQRASVEDVHAEQWVQEDLACTEERMSVTKERAEQWASVEDVHAEQRVQEDLAYAEQQASVKDVHTEERVQESLACTEERMPSTEEHAEQRVSVEEIHAEEPVSQDLAHGEDCGSGPEEHTELRGLPWGRSEEPCVRQFTWQEPKVVSMMVPARFGVVKTAAVIDTAAQVTIMSSNWRERLSLKPGSHDETVLLRNAERDSTMQGVVWKHVGFQLGERKYFWDIMEADISDALILGIDFLRRYQCKIDLGSSVLEMGDGEKIHASMRGQDSRVYHVSRVLLAKTISVPPLSVRYVETLFENPADVPFAVDPHSRQNLFIPPVLLNGSTNAQLCLMNMTDHHVRLKRNAELGCAVETDIVVVPREDPKMDEPSADVYWRGPEDHTVSET